MHVQYKPFGGVRWCILLLNCNATVVYYRYLFDLPLNLDKNYPPLPSASGIFFSSSELPVLDLDVVSLFWSHRQKSSWAVLPVNLEQSRRPRIVSPSNHVRRLWLTGKEIWSPSCEAHRRSLTVLSRTSLQRWWTPQWQAYKEIRLRSYFPSPSFRHPTRCCTHQSGPPMDLQCIGVRAPECSSRSWLLSAREGSASRPYAAIRASPVAFPKPFPKSSPKRCWIKRLGDVLRSCHVWGTSLPSSVPQT
jgi:hypothetical protein